LFTSEQLRQPVSKLSGGERARILIAKLMLEPADVLLLDEPTNDLDIQTLEILEENLVEYSGALVMVTHDRFLLDRVSTVVLGLDGLGAVAAFADYTQWDAWQKERQRQSSLESSAKAKADGRGQSGSAATGEGAGKKKLSYLEAREYSTIEQRISDAEAVLRAKRVAFEDPAIASDAESLLSAQAELNSAQEVVDDLYARWAELEGKIG
jgi:ATP-binding cassette subfamily F protein uup